MKFIDTFLKRLGYEKVTKSDSDVNKDISPICVSNNLPIVAEPSSPEEIRLCVGNQNNEIVFSRIEPFNLSGLKEVYVTPDQSNFFTNLGSQALSSGVNTGIMANSLKGLYRATASPDQLMRYANGSVSSMVTEGGRITQHTGFLPASSANIFTPMLVFQVSSIITGQYYLNGINKQLKDISKKLDLILQRFDNEKKGVVLAAIEIRNTMAKQSAYTVDDLVRLRIAQDKVLSIYHYYLLELQRTKDSINWEKGCWKTVNDIEETKANIRCSGFFDQLAMASQAYDLYTTFEIIYFKMCLYMMKYDASYSDKIQCLIEHFKSYNKGELKHQEILTNFEEELAGYLKNRWDHANFYLDSIRSLSNRMLEEAREKESLFDEQANIREITGKLEQSIQQKNEIYIDAKGNTAKVYQRDNTDEE